MLSRYVLDEHLRGLLWHALQQQNAGGAHPIDVVRVGDSPDLPLGTGDPTVLLWAEREGRILVTRDVKTMRGHLAAHLQAGHHSPGVFLIRRQATLPEVVDHLVLVAYAGDPAAVRDQAQYIP
jgi:hypothetical protein